MVTDNFSKVTNLPGVPGGHARGVAALVHSEYCNPPAESAGQPSVADQQKWRNLRFERRRVSSAIVIDADRLAAGAADDQWIRPRRVARCSWRIAAQVGVGMGPSGAHFSGTERCGSVWSCPVCAAVIRADRAKEIQDGVTGHIAAGGGAIFITGTIRHRREDSLETGLNAILEGWRRVIRGNPWKKQADRLGLVGIIRSVEVTHGQNGWHPHVHGIMLTESPVSADQLAAFSGWVSDRWATMVTKLGARVPSTERGFTCQNVTSDGKVLASYLSKLQEEKKPAKLGVEVARGDLKTGRAGSRMPFELLDTAMSDAGDRALWLEYVAATHGRRCFSWSKGLRDRLDLGEERTDEEIIADSETVDTIGVLDATVYDGLRRDNRLADLLSQVENSQNGDMSGDLLHLIQPISEKIEKSPRTLSTMWKPVAGQRGRAIGSRDILDNRRGY